MIDIRDRIPSGYTGRYELNMANVEAVVIHHSVSGMASSGIHWNDYADAPVEQETEHLLAIDRWHSPPNNNWGGFGYHAAAFASGRAYLVGSYNTARAHVASQNNKFVGVVLIGDFTDSVPTERHVQAAKQGVADIRAFYGRRLPVKAHRVVQLPQYPTSCPGNKFQVWVPRLEEEEAMPTFTEEQEKRIAEIVSLSAPGLEMQARMAVTAPLLAALAHLLEGAWAGLPADLRKVREAAEFWQRWEDSD